MELECHSVLVLPKYLLPYLHNMTMKEESPCFTVRECSDKKIKVRSTTLLNRVT